MWYRDKEQFDLYSLCQMLKIEDKMRGIKERSTQDKNWVIEINGKNVINKTSSKQEDSRTTTIMFKKYGIWYKKEAVEVTRE